MVRDSLNQAVENARQSSAYRRYLEVRDRVLDMMEEAQRLSSGPSRYWSEEVAGFEYMLDAPPLVVDRLRHHCYHLTGLQPYEYRDHHSMRREEFVEKLAALRRAGGDGVLVPESPLLGGFGHDVDGRLFNLDTLKFYEVLIGLNKAGMLSGFRGRSGEGKTVMEIGAGWGGFAYQFKTLCPRVTYVIVDLPQSLLFSATYVGALFPEARVFVYGDGPTPGPGDEPYDFIFLPHYAIGDSGLPRPDLAINMVSFQEMTTEQVDQYARRVHELGCPSFYSLNRDVSRYNTQLTSVGAVLGRYFHMSEMSVLPVQYTELRLPPPKRPLWREVVSAAGSPRTMKRAFVRWLLGRRSGRSAHVYRHLAGSRRDTTA